MNLYIDVIRRIFYCKYNPTPTTEQDWRTMGRKAPPRKAHIGLGNRRELAAVANQDGQDARREREAAEAARLAKQLQLPPWERDLWVQRFDEELRVPEPSRPTPTVGFGHDPTIGSRPRKAAKAAAKAAAKRSPNKK